MVILYIFNSRPQVDDDDEQAGQEYEDDFEVMPHLWKSDVEFTACVHCPRVILACRHPFKKLVSNGSFRECFPAASCAALISDAISPIERNMRRILRRWMRVNMKAGMRRSLSVQT